jgi:hypothetical protein
VGVKVATVLLLLKVTVPVVLFPLASFKVNDTVLGVTACENVAVGATDTGTAVAPALGVAVVTVGGVVTDEGE